MTGREHLIDDFLRATPWATWTRQPLVGDASSRRYERLSQAHETVILMDAPPETGNDTQRFADVAQALKACGLCPPEVLSHDPSRGLMVLSDLGKTDLATHAGTNPGKSIKAYHAAVDVLVRLHKSEPDIDLAQLDATTAGQMVEITGTFYAQRQIGPLVELVTKAMTDFVAPEYHLALRDYHAENIIWREDMQGTDRIGLLDFQDAFFAPAGYDLASLRRDVRRDIDETLVADITRHFIQNAGLGHRFQIQVAVLGAQRNLRILGVFARLAKVNKKPKYLSLLPRVWSNLLADLSHPELQELRTAVQDILPGPQDIVKDLAPI